MDGHLEARRKDLVNKIKEIEKSEGNMNEGDYRLLELYKDQLACIEKHQTIIQRHADDILDKIKQLENA